MIVMTQLCLLLKIANCRFKFSFNSRGEKYFIKKTVKIMVIGRTIHIFHFKLRNKNNPSAAAMPPKNKRSSVFPKAGKVPFNCGVAGTRLFIPKKATTEKNRSKGTHVNPQF